MIQTQKRNDSIEFYRMSMASRKLVAVIVCVCLICASIGLNDYNSPFALVIAAGTFSLALRIKMPSWLSRTCAWLGPSMFSVYLMHSHGYAWKYLSSVEEFFLTAGVKLPFAWLLTAMCVFCVCIALDLPRRAMKGFLK